VSRVKIARTSSSKFMQANRSGDDEASGELPMARPDRANAAVHRDHCAR